MSHTPVLADLVPKNSNVTLDCNITGVGLNYVWTLKGEVIVGSSRYALTPGKLHISGVRFSDAGAYTCIANNRVGNTTQLHNLTVFGEYIVNNYHYVLEATARVEHHVVRQSAEECPQYTKNHIHSRPQCNY